MEFTEYKCPVCDKQFVSGDDIVVCPECGAPHHRECYENNGHCFYEDKHSEDFSFEKMHSESSGADSAADSDGSGETVTCPNCKEINSKETFFCVKCGFPLNSQDKQKQNADAQNQQNNNQNMPPFGMPYGTNPQQFNMAFDPMAGFKNEEPIGENVTAGEMSKFVGKSTPYFLRIFGSIKRFNKSRANFAAFILTGIYFLYRKMYGLGILFSALLIGLTVGETLVELTPQFQSLYAELLNASAGSMASYSAVASQFTMQELLFLNLPTLFYLIKIGLMVVSGCIANRAYYKHCVKKINDIKIKNDGANLSKEIESKGGVCLPLAICIFAVYVVIIYLPLFL